MSLDDDDPQGLGLSEMAYQLHRRHIRARAGALCCVTSPTVNCYKRLQVGAGALFGCALRDSIWTPAFISYGDNNRTQMIRTAGPGHLEDRTVSAACNPYLAMAAYVWPRALTAVRKKLDPGKANLGQPLRPGPGRDPGVRGIRAPAAEPGRVGGSSWARGRRHSGAPSA